MNQAHSVLQALAGGAPRIISSGSHVDMSFREAVLLSSFLFAVILFLIYFLFLRYKFPRRSPAEREAEARQKKEVRAREAWMDQIAANPGQMKLSSRDVNRLVSELSSEHPVLRRKAASLLRQKGGVAALRQACDQFALGRNPDRVSDAILSAQWSELEASLLSLIGRPDKTGLAVIKTLAEVGGAQSLSALLAQQVPPEHGEARELVIIKLQERVAALSATPKTSPDEDGKVSLADITDTSGALGFPGESPAGSKSEAGEEPWHVGMRLNGFSVKKDEQTLRFLLPPGNIAPYHLLLFPAIHVALFQLIGRIGKGEFPLVFFSLLFLFGAFLFFDAKLWSRVIRNRTVHKKLHDGLALPIATMQMDGIDMNRPLIIDGNSYSPRSVQGVEIAGITFVDRSTRPVADRVRVSLDETHSPLPPPWTPQRPGLEPIYSPTLVLHECAYQLSDTKDLDEAVDFTRRLRRAFSQNGPLQILGLHPLTDPESLTIFGVLSLLPWIGSFFLREIAFRSFSFFQDLILVGSCYVAHEALMFLSLIISRRSAGNRGKANFAWLKANTGNPAPPGSQGSC